MATSLSGHETPKPDIVISIGTNNSAFVDMLLCSQRSANDQLVQKHVLSKCACFWLMPQLQSLQNTTVDAHCLLLVLHACIQHMLLSTCTLLSCPQLLLTNPHMSSLLVADAQVTGQQSMDCFSQVRRCASDWAIQNKVLQVMEMSGSETAMSLSARYCK